MTQRNNSKHILIEKEGYYSLVLERYEDKWLLHCDVHKWSKELYQVYLEDWTEAVASLKEHGINELYAVFKNEKTGRFAELFGFEPYGTAKDANGEFLVHKLSLE